MRLIVKQGDRVINEFKFAEGPIRIGRHVANQICLSDNKVSKQHAVIFNVEDAQWMVEDLDSANKTYLNNQAVHKAKIKTGDSIRVGDFVIEVDLEDVPSAPAETEKTTAEQTPAAKTSVVDTGKPAGKTVFGKLSDTKKSTALIARDAQIIARKPGAEKPAPLRFPGERAADFLKAITQISKADSIDNLMLVLLDIVSKQFKSYQTWCTLRSEPSGEMAAQAGKTRDGKSIEFDDLKLKEKIGEAMEDGEFLLFVFSREPTQEDRTSVRSILIAPVISSTGCFGVLYANNTFIDDHYNLGDLDYLMLLAMHTATVLERF